MSFNWNFDLNTRFEHFLLGTVETGPRHLKEFASELGIELKSTSDKNSLKYRMRKIVDKNEDLQYFGYTSDGYMIPVYIDQFERISKPLRRRGEGMIGKSEKLDNGARQIGKRRENQPEQLDLFDKLSEEGS
ncbi:hypothetical protein [Paenibacillus koleovorans]|uniref:hypothetical protein n=1 Tax=Paenibacillus koleovorans TaxID=121608 RepID=UPI000FDC8243|nr:hypothetical protein [Paenibacillus koleovorans]